MNIGLIMSKRKVLFFLLICIVFLLMKYTPILHYCSLDNILVLKEQVAKLGALSVVAYILFTILCCVLLIPIIPIAVLASLLFGSLLGTVLASFATTLGCALSFLLARYLMRDYIKNKMSKSSVLKEIHEKTDKYGIVMLMITRLIPVFPFGMQNYVYGITNIKFSKFLFYSWISMLPATCIVVFSCDIILSGSQIDYKSVTLLTILLFLVIGLTKVVKSNYNKTM